MSNVAKKLSSKKVETSAEQSQSTSTHYVQAKSSDKGVEDKVYLSFYTNEGQNGEMISQTISDKNIERFIEFADFVTQQVEAGNKVYLNFNKKKEA